MKRRTYVKMSTWMQPVVWMRLGRVGLRLPGVSELVGELSQGSLRLPDVSELARGVQPGAGQAHASWPKAPSPRTLLGHVAVVVDGEVMSASVHS